MHALGFTGVPAPREEKRDGACFTVTAACRWHSKGLEWIVLSMSRVSSGEWSDAEAAL